MRALFLSAIFLTLTNGACSSGDSNGGDAASVDAGVDDAGDAPATDAGEAPEGDASSTPDGSDGGPPTATGCGGLPDAAGLAAPAAGKSVVRAALCEAADGYNGLSRNYEGAEIQSGITNQNVLSISSGESTTRNIIVELEDENVGVGTVTIDGGIASSNKFIYTDSRTDTAIKRFNCGGPFIIDSLENKVYRYHFDMKCTATSGSAAVGSVRMTGYGASTLR